MMIYPPIDELAKMVDSRYELVTALSKRARDIISMDAHLTEKPIAMAIEELSDGKFSIISSHDDE